MVVKKRSIKYVRVSSYKIKILTTSSAAIITDLHQRLEAREAELAEFQRDSKEYEAELEREIDQFEMQKSSWEADRRGLEAELQRCRERLVEGSREISAFVEERAREDDRRSAEVAKLEDRVRELEVENDELERVVR